MTINKLDGLAAGCFWMLAGLLYPVSTGGAAALLITGVDTNSPSPHVKAFGADTHAVMQSDRKSVV